MSEKQTIPAELEQQIQMVTNHAIATVVNSAEGKSREQIFEELKAALNKVGVQPADESVRILAGKIHTDVCSKE